MPTARNCPFCFIRGARCLAWGAVVLLLCAPGCSALHPLKGIPANHFPREFQGEVRSGKQTIDLSLLRQTPPEKYLLDAGDVLAVYVEGVIGRPGEAPPVHVSPTHDAPPALGYPVPVREDGTISLPLVGAIPVRGLAVAEAEAAVRAAYTDSQKLLQEKQIISVALQQPRTYNVLVIRQEAGASELVSVGTTGKTLNLGAVKRGTGRTVALKAYKNDVLHALAETGGLPGIDAENTIFVIRRRRDLAASRKPVHPALPSAPQHGPGPLQPTPDPGINQASYHHRAARGTLLAQAMSPAGPAVQPTPAGPGHAVAPPPAGPQVNEPLPGAAPGMPGPPFPGWAPGGAPHQAPLVPGLHVPHGADQMIVEEGRALGELSTLYGRDTQIIRIPVRLFPGEVPQFTEEDVILHDGDIVFIESRDTEIFYTGGLLGGGQYALPRDYDLDVLGAIAIATASQSGSGGAGFGNRIGGISSTNQDISVSASDVVILRQLADGNQVPIKVNLYKALRDPKHRVRIQPGDYVILQYKLHEAVAAFIERNLLAGSLFGLAASNSNGN